MNGAGGEILRDGFGRVRVFDSKAKAQEMATLVYPGHSVDVTVATRKTLMQTCVEE